VTLEAYRRRHALYKRDPDLQAAHAAHPWITVWDDHESANNSWKGGAKNHDPDREGSWTDRKLAAIRAYYEWMPVRELPTGLYRRFRFGSLLDLLMLDTRLHARDEQGPRDRAVARDPERQLLGEDQAGWLRDALVDSQRSGSHWRVIGQQVIVSPVSIDGVDFNPDSWSGYEASRTRLLDHVAREAIDNVVFLTGDVHSAWVFDVPPPPGAAVPYDAETGSGALAVEFVTPAISSRPIGLVPGIADYYAGIEAVTPHLAYVNLVEQGFVLLDLTPERVVAQYVYTGPAETRSSAARCGPAFITPAGSNHVRPASAGLCGPSGR
jgi:alkaline phosphatase D